MRQSNVFNNYILETLKDSEQRIRSYLCLLKCDDEFIANELRVITEAQKAVSAQIEGYMQQTNG